jgi:hypothetical protein
MIHDEFSYRKDISRARRYQLRHQRDGICVYCAEPAVTKFHCLKHAAAIRERMRKRLGCVRRNVGAASYSSLAQAPPQASTCDHVGSAALTRQIVKSGTNNHR